KNPEDLIRFQQDMARFEIRMKNLEDTYAKQGLSPEKAHEKAEKELAATAHELTRLLEAKDNPKLGVSAADRVLLAEQALEHAADPTAIDQGAHPTCQTTTVEARIFTTDPSKAVKLIADVSTTGEYMPPGGTPDGKPVKVAPLPDTGVF